MHVILSCAISVDGYLDDASDTRLVLSNKEDLARVHDVRAGVDAIMVGANTIRRDNPRLLVRDSMSGPTKVSVTASGDVDPASRFFTVGNATKLVYAPTPTAGPLRDRLRDLATVIDCGPIVELPWILDDLSARGVNRLMVEGGGTLLTQFLTAGLADELQLAIAPLFVGDPRAPRFVHDGHFGQPMVLAEVRQLDEIVVLRYLFGQRSVQSGSAGPTPEDRHRLQLDRAVRQAGIEAAHLLAAHRRGRDPTGGVRAAGATDIRGRRRCRDPGRGRRRGRRVGHGAGLIPLGGRLVAGRSHDQCDLSRALPTTSAQPGHGSRRSSLQRDCNGGGKAGASFPVCR